MIIKYYYKGWNYLDNIEQVNWSNKSTKELFEKIKKENLYDDILKMKPDEFPKESLALQAMHEVSNKLNIHAYTSIFAIEDEFARKYIESGDNYVRILSFKKKNDDMDYILSINKDFYIMNDDGQTIESCREFK